MTPGTAARRIRLARPPAARVLGGLLLAPGAEPAAVGRAVAAAALFAPVRRGVQHVVDRRFNRARYDADRTLAAFSGRLTGALDLDSVRDELANTVRAALEPTHVSGVAADR